MIDLLDVSYVRLGTADLDSSVRYATEVLGLQVARRSGKSVYLRSDARDHTLVYTEGNTGDQVSGFQVRTPDELANAAAVLEAAGVAIKQGSVAEAEQRSVNDFITFSDPSGNLIDLVIAPHHSGRRYFPSRDAGITGFSHIGLCTTNAKRDEAFWTTVLGARVSDRIGDAALLRIDGVHHKVALLPAPKGGVQHINHQVESIDDIMRAWYILREKNVRIRFGPGRHPTSGAMFLYFEGPDGMVFEYSSGVRILTEEEDKTHQPRQFPFEPISFCMWGSKPEGMEFHS
ncbi:bleomycin resistance protein [Paraburkholderia phytofirmans OLGA172]|uniref:Bleomycin resistance protein n=1 Tax=Paraburkholderia phytofirmans OLGA172 TaxID=1417228 RepID=A0A160FQ17_9BURK|nr:VOC family protein [Paraburkholderia phytofirmans]ANB74960.1 bleomycin resistance protein [Paraburkholderia phytofirmans OLGA172]